MIPHFSSNPSPPHTHCSSGPFERRSMTVPTCRPRKQVRLAESCNLSLTKPRHPDKQARLLKLSRHCKRDVAKWDCMLPCLQQETEHLYQMPDVARLHSRAYVNEKPGQVAFMHQDPQYQGSSLTGPTPDPTPPHTLSHCFPSSRKCVLQLLHCIAFPGALAFLSLLSAVPRVYTPST